MNALQMQLSSDKKMTNAEKTAKYDAAVKAANAQLEKLYTPQQKAMIDKLNNERREVGSLIRLYQNADLTSGQ